MPNTMGKVVFLDPIDHISGKIAKKFRTIYNYMKATGLKYTSVHGDRTTKVTQIEQLIRNKFSAVSRATATRLKDPTQMASDQVAFKAQSQYKTLRQYVWAAEAAKWEQNNG